MLYIKCLISDSSTKKEFIYFFSEKKNNNIFQVFYSNKIYLTWVINFFLLPKLKCFSNKFPVKEYKRTPTHLNKLHRGRSLSPVNDPKIQLQPPNLLEWLWTRVAAHFLLACCSNYSPERHKSLPKKSRPTGSIQVQ